jgi:predicted nucleotidyltransferase
MVSDGERAGGKSSSKKGYPHDGTGGKFCNRDFISRTRLSLPHLVRSFPTPRTRKSEYIITHIQWIITRPGIIMKKVSAISNAELDEIVRRIVEVAQPEQVLLFGSTARGTTGPHSDLDFLVIKTGRYNARNVAGRIYRRMRGIARSIDLIIVTPQQVKDNRNSPFSVLYPALREGRVMYERKKAVA